MLARSGGGGSLQTKLSNLRIRCQFKDNDLQHHPHLFTRWPFWLLTKGVYVGRGEWLWLEWLDGMKALWEFWLFFAVPPEKLPEGRTLFTSDVNVHKTHNNLLSEPQLHL